MTLELLMMKLQMTLQMMRMTKRQNLLIELPLV
jgi:hypothetical protein